MSTPKPEQIIMTTGRNSENKIYFREQFGHFQSIRRNLSIVLLAIFVLLPFVRYQSQAAINIDVAAQTIRLFALTLYPQDLFVLVIVFILAAFVLFYVSRLYGRVWCGYTCPQTIWMLLFNWVERRVEGNFQQSKALDKSGLTWQKIAKKSVKHSIWLLLALLTASTFMSYFVPAEVLYPNLFNFNDYFLTQNWLLFFTACTYVNAGWIKEKMCLHMCPYARFQSALVDNTSKLVSYNQARGESRGQRKRNATKPNHLGDCVDCKLCVEVCPVGIDIRQGLQYSCINCGLCIDACDAVMDKFNYAKGLISYSSITKPASRWRQHLTYGFVTAVMILILIFWMASRSEFEADISRDRNALYRVNYLDEVENTYKIKLLNKSQQPKQFVISLQANDNFALKHQGEITLAGGQSDIQILVVKSNSLVGTQQIAFQITDVNKQESEIIYSQFHSPEL
ncbi:cytochrome c oxidase accessory protein CcoG [Catenovulum agarivorans]|uniref:cytochrome c oxidase accessory protein CcoG n=1 Tax=Catenovulum agarivorans TaxID=1172192 RepID=UPI0002D9CAE3|nr:cytochrome c oxidase accessory protein CcoG [Catenovulum agarivorans]